MTKKKCELGPFVKDCAVCNEMFLANSMYIKCCSLKCSKKRNSENNKIYAKTYNSLNKLKMREYSKKWYFNNREKRKIQIAVHHQKYKKIKARKLKERIKSNPIVHLNRVIRSNFNLRIKACNIIKDGHIFDMLGYSVFDLKKHLEKQFTSEMSWENFGSYWNIDHVVPISWFKTKKQVICKGWALNNLQPLENKVNWSKNNKFVGNPVSSLGVVCL
jgi:hypothetical protein